MTSRAALALVACIAAPSALSFHQPYTPLRPHAAIAMRQPALIMRADRQEQPKAQPAAPARKIGSGVTLCWATVPEETAFLTI